MGEDSPKRSTGATIGILAVGCLGLSSVLFAASGLLVSVSQGGEVERLQEEIVAMEQEIHQLQREAARREALEETLYELERGK